MEIGSEIAYFGLWSNIVVMVYNFIGGIIERSIRRYSNLEANPVLNVPLHGRMSSLEMLMSWAANP